MKQSTCYLFTLIFSIFLFTTTQAQPDKNFNNASINVSVPVIVNWNKVIVKKEDGKISRKSDPAKAMYLTVNIMVKDLKFNGLSFSGKQIVNFPVYDELKTFSGKLSKDKSKIEFIDIKYNRTKYSIADRKNAHLEEEASLSFRFENIPVKYKSYSFNHETTKIQNVNYSYKRFLDYPVQTESTTEEFVKIDEEKINKYSNCITVKFKEGTPVTKENSSDYLVVIIGGNEEGDSDSESILWGAAAFLVHDFTQVKGLKVLERQHLDKLKKEIELSKSGLVDRKHLVKDGKQREADVEVILMLTDRKPEDIKQEFETLTFRTLIKDVSTGEIADPGFSFTLTYPGSEFFGEKFKEFRTKVVDFTRKYYLF